MVSPERSKGRGTSVWVNDETQARIESIAAKTRTSNSSVVRGLIRNEASIREPYAYGWLTYDRESSLTSMYSSEDARLSDTNFPQWLERGLAGNEDRKDRAVVVYMLGTSMLKPIKNHLNVWEEFTGNGGQLKLVVSSTDFPPELNIGNEEIQKLTQKQSELHEIISSLKKKTPENSIELRRSSRPIVYQDTILLARESGIIEIQTAFKESAVGDTSFKLLVSERYDHAVMDRLSRDIVDRYENSEPMIDVHQPRLFLT